MEFILNAPLLSPLRLPGSQILGGNLVIRNATGLRNIHDVDIVAGIVLVDVEKVLVEQFLLNILDLCLNNWNE